MFDQSFSKKNLTKIYHDENKKGRNVAGIFFPELLQEYENIKRVRVLVGKLFSSRKRYGRVLFDARLKKYLSMRSFYTDRKNAKIEYFLEEVSLKISSRKFEFDIKKLPYQKNGKDVYVLENNSFSFFAEKQIQKNIRYTYRVKQEDRDIIVPQLRSVLQDNFPKLIVKADIESFYESIDRNLLMQKLNDNPVLSLSTRKLIAKLLRDYGKISGSDRGIPRGIGISAYLAELYLKSFDQKVSAINGLIYYARYVDDIVTVIAKKNGNSAEDYCKTIEEYLSFDKLSSKEQKSGVINYSGKEIQFSFDYLGYKFDKKGDKLDLHISDKKKKKYLDRIRLSFDRYNKNSIKQPVKSRKEFFLRLKFLTSNTRLSNNKGNALVGIYGSNRWLTDTRSLEKLDCSLKGLSNQVKDPFVKEKIKSFSFADGFVKKKYFDVLPSEFNMIVKVWN